MKRACVQDQGQGCVLARSDILWSVSEEVHNPSVE